MTDLPERLNAATPLVDDQWAQGRAGKPAILCGLQTVTYARLQEAVNRFGNVLLELGVRMEERVAILLARQPRMGLRLLRDDQDRRGGHPHEHPAGEQGLRVSAQRLPGPGAGVHAAFLDRIAPFAAGCGTWPRSSSWEGRRRHCLSFETLMDQSSTTLDPADTSKDDMAFWLYSSGTTGFPKGAIHLHHDMIVAADRYARETLGLVESDVSFSVAKLFFAYGLGNGLYFPLRTGGTTVLLPDRPTPEAVFETIDCHRPTVFYSVPTNYAALLQEAEKTGRTSLQGRADCVSAGETLPRHLFLKWRERFGVEILDGIGSTEILHIFISNRPGRARPGSTGRNRAGFRGPHRR